jgi:hypothetical protein
MLLHRLKKFLVLFYIVLFCFSCSENNGKPIEEITILIDTLTSGAGLFSYTYSVTNYSKKINVYYYIPENKTATTPILFVFHGDERNAKDYRDVMIAEAEIKGFIVIAPEFSEQNFPGGDTYNLGNVFIDGDNPTQSTLNPEAQWTFSIIEPLLTYFKTQINNTTDKYFIFGHSAGAQFAHRLLMFKPNLQLEKAVISAAGWYTFPNSIIFPYGKNQSPLENLSLPLFFEKNVYIQVGENDNNPNAFGLRHNIFADAQGLNRKQRAENYFQFCQEIAGNISFNWNFNIVENAGHDYVEASNNAINLLFN